MSNLFKVSVIVLLVAVSAFVQLAVWAFAFFRVTSNLEWLPVQLVAFAFDGIFILAVWRFMRHRPGFWAAALFVFVGDVALLLLAWLAREAPYRFSDWFIP